MSETTPESPAAAQWNDRRRGRIPAAMMVIAVRAAGIGCAADRRSAMDGSACLRHRPFMTGSAPAPRGGRSLLASLRASRPSRGGGDVAAAVPAELAGLDWSVIACQCGHGCSRPARYVAEFHAVDHCGCSGVNDAGNLVQILCGHCLSTLRVSVAVYARRLSRRGRPACQTCGVPIATVGDILRSVRPL